MKIVVNLDLFSFIFLKPLQCGETQYMHVEHKTLHIIKNKIRTKIYICIIYTLYIQSKMFKVEVIHIV